MFVGLIADTHDRLPYIKRAVDRLNEEDVEAVLHAGDYIAPFVVKYFKPLKARMIGVFGNNDSMKRTLTETFSELGFSVNSYFRSLELDGRRFALTHGDEEELLRSLIDSGYYDVVVYGHTHKMETYMRSETLVVNPGEVCGYLTNKSTIAILNTETLEVRTVLLK